MTYRPPARDVVIEALTARHEELHDEAMPRDHEGGDQIIRALENAGYQIVTRAEPGQPNVAGALEEASQYAYVDGSHHKMWVIDQMVRSLTGCPLVDMVNTFTASGEPYHYKGLGESEAYREFVANARHWSEGIAP